MDARLPHLLLPLLATGCAALPSAGASPPTWWADIRPMVYDRCGGCHVEGFDHGSFETWEEVSPTASLMLDKMSGSESAPYIMPPWPAPDDADCAPPAPWLHDPRLTAEEIDAFRAWVDAGTPEGEEATAAEATPGASPHLRGVNIASYPGIDTVIPGSETSSDHSVCTSFDARLTETGYLKAIEVIPDNSEAIHHVVIATDPYAESPVDASQIISPCVDPDVDGNVAAYTGSLMLFTWIQNTGAFVFPEDAAMTLPAGARLTMVVHYHQDTVPQYDNSTIALQWLDERPAWNAWTGKVGGTTRDAVNASPEGYYGGWTEPPFAIESGDAEHEEVWRQTWGNPESEEGRMPLWGVFPHMHYTGAAIQTTLEHPDGSSECLASIDTFDFAWQTTYQYDAEVDDLPVISPGDTLDIDCHYDNSLGNDRLAEALEAAGYTEPFDVTVGENAFDEMCAMHFGVMVPNE